MLPRHIQGAHVPGPVSAGTAEGSAQQVLRGAYRQQGTEMCVLRTVRIRTMGDTGRRAMEKTHI
eukprot:55414-Eustigmatos_ZCMA.PRE.1